MRSRQSTLRWFVCKLLMMPAALGMQASAAELHVPRQYRTIQAAVDAAQNGDSVIIAPGTYKEQVKVTAKLIQIIGEQGAGSTILDGQGSPGSLIWMDDPKAGSLVEGLTLQNAGSDRVAAAAFRLEAAAMTIKSCVFRNNASAEFGAGARLYSAKGTFVDCVFEDNRALRGAGVYQQLGNGTSFTNCIFSGNHAWGGAQNGRGGGAFVDNATFVECTFENNVAENLFSAGSALCVVGGANATLGVHSCTFTGNVNSAILQLAGQAEVTQSDFVSNGISQGLGGAIHSRATLNVSNSVFTGNVADDGGAIMMFDPGTLTLSQSQIVKNSAKNGGGVAGVGAACVMTLEACNIVSNSAIFYGGGAGCDHGATLHVKKCVIEGNVAPGGGGLWVGVGPPQNMVSLEQSYVCGNTPDDIDGDWTDLEGNTVCWDLDGDLNDDERIDGADLGLFLGSWGVYMPATDLNNDLVTNAEDLEVLLANWTG